MTSPASIRCAGTKGDVALEADQGPGSGQGGLVQGGVTGVDGDKTRALGTLLTGDGWPGRDWLERSESGCPGPRGAWSMPTPPSTSLDGCAGPTPAHGAC